MKSPPKALQKIISKWLQQQARRTLKSLKRSARFCGRFVSKAFSGHEIDGRHGHRRIAYARLNDAGPGRKAWLPEASSPKVKVVV